MSLEIEEFERSLFGRMKLKRSKSLAPGSYQGSYFLYPSQIHVYVHPANSHTTVLFRNQEGLIARKYMDEMDEVGVEVEMLTVRGVRLFPGQELYLEPRIFSREKGVALWMPEHEETENSLPLYISDLFTDK